MTMTATKTTVPVGVRVVSVLLLAGSAIGWLWAYMVGSSAWHDARSLGVAVCIAAVPLFGWAAVKAIDLWRGRPSGYRSAAWLFAAQIPIVSIGRWTYEFSMGASARFSLGDTGRHFGGDIGSSLNLFSLTPHGWMVGVNIVALAIATYLVTVIKRQRVALVK
ncbi:MAG: hypothetical protein ABI051_06005 [Vicinamibacterales bacterium]